MKLLCAIALVALALVVNGGVPSTTPPATSLKSDFLKDSLTSAFTMFREINSTMGSENFVYSPLSVQLVLAMLAAGARGQTLRQIERVLHYNHKTAKYDDPIDQYGLTVDKFFGDKEAGAELANRIYLTSGTTVKPDFINTLQQTLKSSVGYFTQGASEETAKMINDWVASKTNNEIKDLIDEGEIDALTEMILVNAIYFKASWKYPFQKKKDPKEIVNIKWKILNDNGIEGYEDVDAMISSKIGNFYYIDQTEHHVRYFAIPYEDAAGGDVYFVIAMPTDSYQSALEDFMNYLSNGYVNVYLQKLQKDVLASEAEKNEAFHWKRSKDNSLLKMPLFNIDSKIGLRENLANLGVEDMFNALDANFKGITDRDIYVKFFKHAAMLKVNREGTVAAAATAAGAGTRSIGLGKPDFNIFEVDQPFFCGIWDRQHFLFMGKVDKPKTT